MTNSSNNKQPENSDDETLIFENTLDTRRRQNPTNFLEELQQIISNAYGNEIDEYYRNKVSENDRDNDDYILENDVTTCSLREPNKQKHQKVLFPSHPSNKTTIFSQIMIVSFIYKLWDSSAVLPPLCKSFI